MMAATVQDHKGKISGRLFPHEEVSLCGRKVRRVLSVRLTKQPRVAYYPQKSRLPQKEDGLGNNGALPWQRRWGVGSSAISWQPFDKELH